MKPTDSSKPIDWRARLHSIASGTEAQPTDSQPTDSQPTDSQPTDAQSTDAQSDNQQPSDALVVCPRCLLRNLPSAAFCKDCGAPIGMVSTVDPLQHILAEGFAYRSAVDGPPRLMIVVGIWLLFGPTVFTTIFMLFDGSLDSAPQRLFWLLFAAASIVILYRTTKNYIIKSRAAKNTNA